MADLGRHGVVVDKDHLPAAFPTHRHSPEFWEHLGRVVGTFGMLEEVLGKAIFAVTGSQPLGTVEPGPALMAWQEVLEHALTDTLNPLIDSFGRALRDHPNASVGNHDELLRTLREAAALRNVLCHGSWQPPDEGGRSRPLFVDKKLRVLDVPVDVPFLQQTQREAGRLICDVVSVVTSMGLQFPGSHGPGTPVW